MPEVINKDLLDVTETDAGSPKTKERDSKSPRNLELTHPDIVRAIDEQRIASVLVGTALLESEDKLR